MAKTKRQVTLTNETISALEKEGLGSLSTGIELLFRDWTRGHTPADHRIKMDSTPHKKPANEIPDDPRNPTNNWNVAQRLAREDAEVAEAKQEAYDKPRREFRHRIEHTVIHGHGPRVYQEFNEEYADLIPADERKAITDSVMMDLDVLAERDHALRQAEESRQRYRIRDEQLAAGWTDAEITADYRRRNNIAPDNPVQTIRLSAKALKGLGLFGTPEALTDAQIRELNDDWENRDADILTDDDGFGTYES
ncbi:MAG: hypothetical protein ACYC36_02470 [Bellilinea sp.]